MLGDTDQLGYDFEFEEIEKLIMEGFKKYIVYTNPRNEYFWQKKKQKGVDLVLHIGKYRIYVEIRFHSCFYHYRTQWFQKSTMQRFAPYPHKKNDYHIVLTNRPENYETEQINQIKTATGVFIFSIHDLIWFIRGLISDIREYYINWYYSSIYNQHSKHSNNNNNNVYASQEHKLKNYQEILIEALEMKRKETERLRLLYGG